MSDAQEAEALKKTVTVEYEGHTYEVDPTNMTWGALKADSAGGSADAVEAWLGPEQWETFKRNHPKPLVYDQAGEIANVALGMKVAILVALGNSGASSGS